MRALGIVLLAIWVWWAVPVTGQQEDKQSWLFDHFQRARQAQVSNNREAAIREYELIVSRKPRIGEVYANLGLLYHQEKRYAEAVLAFKTALSLKPTLLSPQLFLGIDEYLMEDFKSAAEHLENAVRLEPKDRQAGLYLALTYMGIDAPEKAARQLRQTDQFYPEDPEISYQLGGAYLEVMRQRLAELAKAGTTSPYYHWGLADGAEQKGDLVTAIEQYLDALAIDPNIAELYWRLAQAFREAELPQLSAMALERYRVLNPVRGLALTARDASPRLDHDQAVISQNVKLFSRMWQALPPIDHEHRLPAIADTAVNRIIQRQQAKWPAFGPALDLYLRGDYESAASTISRTLDTAKGDWSTAYVLGSAYFHAGHYESAEMIIEDRLLPYMHLPPVALLAVEAAGRLSFQHFEQVITRQPGSYRARMLAAKSDDVAGHFEKAAAEYRETLKLAPDQLGIHLALGQLYSEHLQWTTAADEFKSEIALDHANAMAKAQLAHAYIKMHEADPAITLLTELLKNSPRDAQGYADLGEAWEQKRETRKAIVAYEHALSCDPSQSKLHYKLFRLYGKVGATADSASHLAAFEASEAKRKKDYQNSIASLK